MSALWAKDEEEGAKRRQQVMLDLLADIRDQRSKMKLEFEDGLTTIKDIYATLLDYDAAGVTVEVSSLKGVSARWTGAPVACFFRIHDRAVRGSEQFLTFQTTVVTAEQRPSGYLHFTLAFPDNVKSAQQRRNVRVKVDQRKVPLLSVWPEQEHDRDPTGQEPLFHSQTHAKRGFKVDNFSANGLRLLVPNALMHERLPHPVKGEHYSLFFTAVSEPGAPPATFWVNAALRNIFNDLQKGETALGFEFIAEGFIDEEKKLIWRPLKFDEVGSLGKFVFKWNLDLYREKGMHG